MIIVATDAPLDARKLKRLAARAWLGVARTGSSASNGSGDYAIAFSTAPWYLPGCRGIRLMIEHGTWYVPTIIAGDWVAQQAKIPGYYPPQVAAKALTIAVR